jgi:colanic acid/amylovoran biosynthesis glycosyltransferase
MKIAYFVDSFPKLSETFVLAQIIGMIDRGHDVTIYANRLIQSDLHHRAIERYSLLDKTIVLPPVSRRLSVRVIQAISAMIHLVRKGRVSVLIRSLDFSRFGRDAIGLRILVRCGCRFGASEYNVIHCQFGQLGIVALQLKQCGSVSGPLITSFRGTDAMKFASKYPESYKNLFRNGDLFLAVSEAVLRRLIELGCPNERIKLLRSGIDISRFNFRAFKDFGQPVRLVSVGRLAPNKGISYVLEAVNILSESGVQVEYRIVGDGPCRDALLQKVSDLNLDSFVGFEGAVDSDRVIGILRDSDILIAPSITGPDGEQEGLPNSLKEAMAAGVLAIGTSIGGIPELIEHGKNGFLVEEKNAQDIADCVIDAISRRNDVKRIVAAARRKVEAEYEIESLNDVLESTYRSLGGI